MWALNLEAEMRHIRDLVDQYPYIAMVLSSVPTLHKVSRKSLNRGQEWVSWRRLPSQIWYHRDRSKHQQQPAINTIPSSSPSTLNRNWTCSMSRIREVWALNLEAEMRHIRDLVDKYPYIAMVLPPVPTLHKVSRTSWIEVRNGFHDDVFRVRSGTTVQNINNNQWST